MGHFGILLTLFATNVFLFNFFSVLGKSNLSCNLWFLLLCLRFNDSVVVIAFDHDSTILYDSELALSSRGFNVPHKLVFIALKYVEFNKSNLHF
jgi:hypothetical protein